MSNSNSKVILRLSSKRKRTKANEPLDVGSPTHFSFKKKNISFIMYDIKMITKDRHDKKL